MICANDTANSWVQPRADCWLAKIYGRDPTETRANLFAVAKAKPSQNKSNKKRCPGKRKL